VQVGVGVLWPRLVALLAACRNCVMPPQVMASVRIPAVDEAANSKLGPPENFTTLAPFHGLFGDKLAES
jgi:hypothetical protein